MKLVPPTTESLPNARDSGDRSARCRGGSRFVQSEPTLGADRRITIDYSSARGRENEEVCRKPERQNDLRRLCDLMPVDPPICWRRGCRSLPRAACLSIPDNAERARRPPRLSFLEELGSRAPFPTPRSFAIAVR